MFRTLAKLVPQDKDLPTRAHTLDVLNRFLDDSIYDLLQAEFHEERNQAGEYLPIASRAPSVRFALLSTVVNDSVSFLFAEGRFPAIDAGDDEAAEEALEGVVKDTSLNDVMIDAAIRGSIGSVAIWVRVLSKRLFFKALDTKFLTPHWMADAPDTLEKVVELYKTKGQTLKDLGYVIAKDDLTSEFWFQRDFTDTQEIWYVPVKVDGDKRPSVIDTTAGRTTKHDLGFVPMVWVKNLPGGDDIDGKCTFKLAIANSIEIDYQLSQGGRGLKYNSSPTLVLNDDNQLQVSKKHVSGDTLIIPAEGEAKLLEMTGDASTAVLAYCEALRKLALESVGGSRADSDKLSAATSGRAMELMNQPLINLADKLRSSYGEGGLLRLLRMVAAISRKIKLVDSTGQAIEPIGSETKISLNWPRWFAPTADDRQADALAVTTLKSGGVISTETAIRAVAPDYDIEDTAKELNDVQAEAQTAQDNQVALKAAQPKPAVPTK